MIDASIVPLGREWREYFCSGTHRVQYTRWLQPYASIAATAVISQCGLAAMFEGREGKTIMRNSVLRAARGPQGLGENI